MNYIKRTYCGILVNGQVNEELEISIYKYLNQLASRYLREVQSVQKVVSKQYQITSNVPIILSGKHAFILTRSIRDYDVCLINVHQVVECKKYQHGTRFVFLDGQILDVDRTTRYIKKKMNEIQYILSDITL